MNKKHVIVLAVVATAAAAGTALAKQLPIVPVPVTVACPPYVFPATTTFQTDWTVVSPQGWLDHGGVNAQGLLICEYGIDKAAPGGRPAFYLQRPVPATYRNCAMDAARTSLVCQTDATPTPSAPR